MLRGNYDVAVDSHRRLIDMDPLFSKVHASLGRTLYLMGRYEEAIEALEHSLSLGGRVPSAVAALGQSLAMVGGNKLHESASQSWKPWRGPATLHPRVSPCCISG